MTPREYNQAKKNLPDFMQDFHDQKDLFKAMHGMWAQRLGEELPAFNWRDSQIYTIDFFLWFMGLHGYKLQKVKGKAVQFYDINQTIKEATERRMEASAKTILQGTRPAP